MAESIHADRRRRRAEHYGLVKPKAQKPAAPVESALTVKKSVKKSVKKG